MVTKAVIYPRNTTHMITRRTVGREFWLRPDYPLVQNILYLLGYEQYRHKVGVHCFSVLSNHMHLLLTDLLGDTLSNFKRDFFSLLGRSTNCFRRRQEALWAGKPNSVYIPPNLEDIIDKVGYIVCNPVEAGLVSHIRKWPGVKVRIDELGYHTFRVRRPDFFYDVEGKMPLTTTVVLTPPRVLDRDSGEPIDPKILIEMIRDAVRQREIGIRNQFQKAQRPFLGGKSVMRRPPWAKPKSEEEAGEIEPHYACKNPKERIRLLAHAKQHQQEYEQCRLEVLAGNRGVRFPAGTLVAKFQYGFNRLPWKGDYWKSLMSDT